MQAVRSVIKSRISGLRWQALAHDDHSLSERQREFRPELYVPFAYSHSRPHMYVPLSDLPRDEHVGDKCPRPCHSPTLSLMRSRNALLKSGDSDRSRGRAAFRSLQDILVAGPRTCKSLQESVASCTG